MKKYFLSGISVLFCSLIIAQNSANLRLNLEKNRIYRLKSTSEQTVAQTVNGVQQSTDSKVDYVLSLKMIDATSDFLVTELRFDTLITYTNTMGKVVSANSTVEGNMKSGELSDVLSCIMNRLSKNALYVKMDFSGRPVEIINLKLISDLVLKDTSSITLDDQTAVAIKKQIAEMVSENSLKTMIEMFTWCLPGREVSAGDSWNTLQKMISGGMALEILTKYHLDGLSDNADITAESDIKAAENADPIESGGATVTYDDLKGLSKSSMVVDKNTGLVIESKGKVHIAGNLGVSAPGFSMQIPLEINGESRVFALK